MENTDPLEPLAQDAKDTPFTKRAGDGRYGFLPMKASAAGLGRSRPAATLRKAKWRHVAGPSLGRRPVKEARYCDLSLVTVPIFLARAHLSEARWWRPLMARQILSLWVLRDHPYRLGGWARSACRSEPIVLVAIEEMAEGGSPDGVAPPVPRGLRIRWRRLRTTRSYREYSCMRLPCVVYDDSNTLSYKGGCDGIGDRASGC